jgi:hypothetical protein
LRNGFSEEYKERKIELEKKKESLWKGGDLGKWKVDQKNLGVKLNQLSNDKNLAKKHMLPKVNFLNLESNIFRKHNVLPT